MDGIGSSSSAMQSIQIDVMKKAQNAQAQSVLKVLDSSAAQTQSTSGTATAAAAITGMGQKIDIKA